MNSNGVPGLSSRYFSVLDRVDQAVKRSSSKKAPVLVAVSKKQPVDSIFELYQLGHRDFGENYVQELVTKAELLRQKGCHEIRWHLIGHLQTNKVKAVSPYISFFHALDSEKLSEKIRTQWKEHKSSKPLPVFIEVNLDLEVTKAGMRSEQVEHFARYLSQLPELELQGLMCIPPAEENPRAKFIQLRELSQTIRPYTRGMLSMGMSSDFEVAIEEGATHIRVGTALFGERTLH